MKSSLTDEQSRPHPSSISSRRIAGLGKALTAKNCLKPGNAAEKVSISDRTFARIDASSYSWYGVPCSAAIDSSAAGETGISRGIVEKVKEARRLKNVLIYKPINKIRASTKTPNGLNYQHAAH